MTIPTLTTLPVAPARTDPPATFVTRADAFLAAIVTFQGEMNTSIGAMNTDIAGVNANVTLAQEWATKNDAAVSGTDWSAFANATGAAPTGSAKAWATTATGVVVADGEYSAKSYASDSATSATASAASATAAGLTAGASLWVSGQSYDAGDAAVSGIDFQTYRAETTTSGTTDPSADANWTLLGYSLPSQTGNNGKYLTTNGTVESWGDVEALPDQTGNSGKFLSTDGSLASWETLAVLGGGGTTTAVPATLTSASVAAHSLTSTGWGKAVTLPDATTLSKGVTVFAFKNDSKYDISIKNNSGEIINFIYASDYVICSLMDNSTADGKWEFSSKKILGLLAQTQIPSIATTSITSFTYTKMSNNKWLILIQHSTTQYGIVYDEATLSFGSLTAIDTQGSSKGLSVVETGTDKALMMICQGASQNYIFYRSLTISGTTITLVDSQTQQVNQINQIYGPQLYKIQDNIIGVIPGNYQMQLQAITIDGSNNITLGTITSFAEGALANMYGGIYPVSAVNGRFSCIYWEDAGDNIKIATLDVSGTTLTTLAGPTAISSNSQGYEHYVFPENSNGNRFIRYANASSDYNSAILLKINANGTFTANNVSGGVFGNNYPYILSWKVVGNKVMWLSCTSDKVTVHAVTDTNGTPTIEKKYWVSNYDGFQAGTYDDGFYFVSNDFQQSEFQLYRYFINGSNEPDRELEDWFEGTNSAPQFQYFGVKTQSFWIPNSGSNWLKNMGNGDIPEVGNYMQASNRYQQIASNNDSGLVTGFWDKENNHIVPFESKRLGALNYDFYQVNWSTGANNLAEGWDVYANQDTDSPNTYNIKLLLRKVCNA